MSKLVYAVFMSWNEGMMKDRPRAVALCDMPAGYFDEAINCFRDGDMGTIDSRGVYQRIWYGDYIENGTVEDLRPATKEEVELYLKYCSVEGESVKHAELEFIGFLKVDDKIIAVYKRTKEDDIPEKKEKSLAEIKKEKFCEYLNELIQSYAVTHSLKGMTQIRTKYPVSSITKEQFFEMNLHVAARNGILLQQDFTDKVYDIVKKRNGNKDLPMFKL